MKRTILFLLVSFISFHLMSQPTDAFKYQAILRDNDSKPVTDESVTLMFQILASDPVSGVVGYKEEHTAQTGPNGLISLDLGKGTNAVGSLSELEWGKTRYYLKTSLKRKQETVFTDLGVSEILAVPLALKAKRAEIADSLSRPAYAAHHAAYADKAHSLSEPIYNQIDTLRTYIVNKGYRSENTGLFLTITGDDQNNETDIAGIEVNAYTTGKNTAIQAFSWAPVVNDKNQMGIFSSASAGGTGRVTGIQGAASGSGTGDRIGLYGNVVGTKAKYSTGVYGYNESVPADSGFALGGDFTATKGNQNATTIGVRGQATAADSKNIGIYGRAENGSENWAGWFDGNLMVNGYTNFNESVYAKEFWPSLKIESKVDDLQKGNGFAMGRKFWETNPDLGFLHMRGGKEFGTDTTNGYGSLLIDMQTHQGIGYQYSSFSMAKTDATNGPVETIKLNGESGSARFNGDVTVNGNEFNVNYGNGTNFIKADPNTRRFTVFTQAGTQAARIFSSGDNFGRFRLYSPNGENDSRLELGVNSNEGGYANFLDAAQNITVSINGEAGSAEFSGKVNVKDVLNLAPRAVAPANPANGDMYFNSIEGKLKIYVSGAWKSLQFEL